MDGKDGDQDSHYFQSLGTITVGMLANTFTPGSTGGSIQWELESTARQLASLAQLQAGDSPEIVGLAGDPGTHG